MNISIERKPSEILRWLKDNKIANRLFNAIRLCRGNDNLVSKHKNDFSHYMIFHYKSNLIGRTFLWDNTAEGEDYWRKMDKLFTKWYWYGE